MCPESLGIRIIETASVDATFDRLFEIPGIHGIEQVFPGTEDPELENLFIARVRKSKLDSALKQVSADPNVKDAWIHPPRKLFKR
ncbi:MAG: hypothetical protein Q8L47_01670 [bacterium]|nr:hypothetical protein [bacterium]